MTDGTAVRRLATRPAETDALSVLDDNRIAVLRHASTGAVLQLVSGRGRPTDLVTLEHPEPLAAYTFATDLFDRPAKDFPAPDWPTDWAKVIPIGVGTGVVILLGLALWIRLWRV